MVRNTAASALANGWTIVLTLVSLPVMLGSLGAEVFGAWALLQTFSALTGWFSLADMGVRTACARTVAAAAAIDDHDQVGRAVGSALAFVAVVAVIGAAVFVVLGTWLLPDLFNITESVRDSFRLAVIPFGIALVADLLGSIMGSIFEGFQRIDRSRGLDALRRTLVLGASMVAALVSGDLTSVVAVAAVASIVTTSYSWWRLRRSMVGVEVRIDRGTLRPMLQYGRQVWMLTGSGVLHRMMDRTLVGIVLGPSAVALVEIAVQVQNGVLSMLSALSQTVTSSAAWLSSRRDPGRLRDLLQRGTRYCCLVILPMCALVAVLAEPLIDVWLGNEYSDAAGLVVLALLYIAGQTPLAVGSNLLVGIGRADEVLRPALVAVVVNLISSLVLIQIFGIAGSFLGTLVGSLVIVPTLARAILRVIDTSARSLWSGAALPGAVVAVAGGLMAGGASFIEPPIASLLTGFAAGGATVVVAAAFVLSGDERRQILALVRPR